MSTTELPTGIDPRDRKYPSFKIWLFGGSWSHKYGNGGSISPSLLRRMYLLTFYRLKWKIINMLPKKHNENQDECCSKT